MRRHCDVLVPRWVVRQLSSYTDFLCLALNFSIEGRVILNIGFCFCRSSVGRARVYPKFPSI